MGVAGFMIYRIVVGGNEALAVTGIVSIIGIVFLTIFVVVIVSIFLGLLRHFFWRVCALEEVGVRESLRRGFAMVRENWKSIGLMWLIMIGLGIAWMIVSVIAIVLTIPVVIITSVIAAVVVAVPGLLLVGLFSLFLSGYLPWIAGGHLRPATVFHPGVLALGSADSLATGLRIHRLDAHLPGDQSPACRDTGNGNRASRRLTHPPPFRALFFMKGARFLYLENGDTFDMISLREKIEWCDLYQAIATGNQSGGIACQSRWIAGNVSDDFRRQLPDSV